jgi:two-component system, chemotaxis family, protein-glutamate methylesterase/glutaminase
VAVAASKGGVQVLQELVAGLPEHFPSALLVVQHRSARVPSYLAAILARRSLLPVREARDGERLAAGVVHLAPPDRHLRVAPGGILRLGDGAKVNRVRPAADVLFRSAAECFGPEAAGVVLTGRGEDGAAGAAEIRRRGGVVLVQDPATCDSPSMPQAVLSGCGADFALPPAALAHALACLVAAPGVTAALFGIPAMF